MRGRPLILCILLSLFCPAFALAGGEPPSPVITITGGTLLPGETLVSSVILDHDLDANGWALSICHDPAVLAVQFFGLGTEALSVNGGSPPDFVGTESTDEGWALQVVISNFGAAVLPPGSHELAVAHYTSVAPGVSNLCPCTLSVPAPPATVIVYSGASLVPAAVCEDVIVPVGPYFVRGDANVDGAVDLGDAVEILNTLFGGGGLAPCLEAADVNADALVDIADPIALLAYLFSGGIAPSAPFPECGADDTVDCVAGTTCL